MAELLSTELGKVEIVSLLELLIDKHILVNSLTINPTSQSKKLSRIKSIVPNEEIRTLFKLPYEVIYGNIGSEIWSSAQSPDFSVARDKLISEIAEWGHRSPLNMPQCFDCSAIGTCGGGCAYGAMLRNGSIWSLDDRFCVHSLKTLEWMIWDLYENSL